MKLNLSTVIELRGALGALDGYQKGVGERVIFVPYKFKDDVRRKIVKNLRALKPLIEDGEEVRLSKIKELSDPATPGFIDDMDGPRQAVYALAWRDLKKNTMFDVDLEFINRSELFVEDKNPIPGSIEEALSPVLIEQPKED